MPSLFSNISQPAIHVDPDEQIELRARAAGEHRATALAHPNIAFIKYWGADDATINLPQSNSISMTLADAHTTTTVAWFAVADTRIKGFREGSGFGTADAGEGILPRTGDAAVSHYIR